MFNKTKIDKKKLHRFYNYKLKFIKNVNKNALSKNRIYSISDYKFEQIKKYLNEHLRKKFIILNHVLFIFIILFIKKLNENLRFCVNYRKLNVIIKRNRYFISLINEILIKIVNCKYFTRLNIIVVFNKLRIHLNNENFITFIISFKIYKYQMFFFKLTNDFIIY